MLPSKQNKYLLLLIGIVTIFLLPFFHQGIPITHDGETQIARFGAYIKAFQDGHVPPRWAGDLNYGYGTPAMNFYYPLPGYLATFLYFFTHSLEITLPILSITSSIIGAIFFFLWIKRYTNNLDGFFVSLLYSLAPYQLLNLYVRGDIGESMAFAILPGILIAVDSWKEKKHLSPLLLAGVLLGLFILAHHGVSLMLLPLIVCYMSVEWRGAKHWVLSFISVIIIGFGLSAFYWIPAFLEQKFTLGDMFTNTMYQQHYLSFFKAFLAPWNFIANVNDFGGQAPQLGIVTTILFLITGAIAVKKRQLSKTALLFFLFFLIGLILSLPISKPLWQYLPLLKKYQFPWRFIALTTISGIAFIGRSFPKLPKIVLYLFIISLLIQAFVMAEVNGYIHHDDSFYFSFPGTTSFHGETLTRWSAGEASSYPKAPLELIDGIATIDNFSRKTHQFSFKVTAQKPSAILVNTVYYPGWVALVDENRVSIQFQDNNHRGLITFRIPEGSHIVRVLFMETKLRLLADILSSITILGVSILMFRERISKR